MSLNGAKLFCINEDGVKGKVFEAKGRKFTFGYYMSCDCVIEDSRAKSVHCEIESDAFGRITIHNLSLEHPVSMNGDNIGMKRQLLSGSKIKIFDQEYIWEFPRTNKHECRDDNTEVTTPVKKCNVPEQAPNSCPNLIHHRHVPQRLTIHNFTTCSINSDDESNNASFEEEINKSIVINSTKNKLTKSIEKKKHPLCQISDMIVTSFTPRQTGVCIEKSFATVKPITPKSVYSTPMADCDFIDFSTPGPSKKTLTHLTTKSPMYLLDLITPNKLTSKLGNRKNLSVTEMDGISNLPTTPQSNSPAVFDPSKTPKIRSTTKQPTSLVKRVLINSATKNIANNNPSTSKATPFKRKILDTPQRTNIQKTPEIPRLKTSNQIVASRICATTPTRKSISGRLLPESNARRSLIPKPTTNWQSASLPRIRKSEIASTSKVTKLPNRLSLAGSTSLLNARKSLGFTPANARARALVTNALKTSIGVKKISPKFEEKRKLLFGDKNKIANRTFIIEAGSSSNDKQKQIIADVADNLTDVVKPIPTIMITKPTLEALEELSNESTASNNIVGSTTAATVETDDLLEQIENVLSSSDELKRQREELEKCKGIATAENINTHDIIDEIVETDSLDGDVINLSTDVSEQEELTEEVEASLLADSENSMDVEMKTISSSNTIHKSFIIKNSNSNEVTTTDESKGKENEEVNLNLDEQDANVNENQHTNVFDKNVDKIIEITNIDSQKVVSTECVIDNTNKLNDIPNQILDETNNEKSSSNIIEKNSVNDEEQIHSTLTIENEPTIVLERNKIEPKIVIESTENEPIIAPKSDENEPTIAQENNEIETTIALESTEKESINPLKCNENELTVALESNGKESIIELESIENEPAVAQEIDEIESTAVLERNEKESIIELESNENESTAAQEIDESNEKESIIELESNENEPAVAQEIDEIEPTAVIESNENESIIELESNETESTIALKSNEIKTDNIKEECQVTSHKITAENVDKEENDRTDNTINEIATTSTKSIINTFTEEEKENHQTSINEILTPTRGVREKTPQNNELESQMKTPTKDDINQLKEKLLRTPKLLKTNFNERTPLRRSARRASISSSTEPITPLAKPKRRASADASLALTPKRITKRRPSIDGEPAELTAARKTPRPKRFSLVDENMGAIVEELSTSAIQNIAEEEDVIDEIQTVNTEIANENLGEIIEDEGTVDENEAIPNIIEETITTGNTEEHQPAAEVTNKSIVKNTSTEPIEQILNDELVWEESICEEVEIIKETEEEATESTQENVVEQDISNVASPQNVKKPISPKTPVMIGVRKLLKTPKPTAATPKLVGIKQLVKTPQIDESYTFGDEADMFGIKEMMQTPKLTSTPRNKGTRDMLKTPTHTSTYKDRFVDLNQTDKVFKTPRGKNIMIPNQPPSAVFNVTDEVTSTQAINTNNDDTDKSIMNSDDKINEYVVQTSTNFTPSRKVYQRKSTAQTILPSPFNTADVFTDLPKSDIEELVDSVENADAVTVEETQTRESSNIISMKADAISNSLKALEVRRNSDMSGINLLDDTNESYFSEALCISDSDDDENVETEKIITETLEETKGNDTICNETIDEDIIDLNSTTTEASVLEKLNATIQGNTNEIDEEEQVTIADDDIECELNESNKFDIQSTSTNEDHKNDINTKEKSKLVSQSNTLLGNNDVEQIDTISIIESTETMQEEKSIVEDQANKKMQNVEQIDDNTADDTEIIETLAVSDNEDDDINVSINCSENKKIVKDGLNSKQIDEDVQNSMLKENSDDCITLTISDDEDDDIIKEPEVKTVEKNVSKIDDIAVEKTVESIDEEKIEKIETISESEIVENATEDFEVIQENTTEMMEQSEKQKKEIENNVKIILLEESSQEVDEKSVAEELEVEETENEEKEAVNEGEKKEEHIDDEKKEVLANDEKEGESIDEENKREESIDDENNEEETATSSEIEKIENAVEDDVKYVKQSSEETLTNVVVESESENFEEYKDEVENNIETILLEESSEEVDEIVITEELKTKETENEKNEEANKGEKKEQTIDDEKREVLTNEKKEKSIDDEKKGEATATSFRVEEIKNTVEEEESSEEILSNVEEFVSENSKEYKDEVENNVETISLEESSEEINEITDSEKIKAEKQVELVDKNIEEKTETKSGIEDVENTITIEETLEEVAAVNSEQIQNIVEEDVESISLDESSEEINDITIGKVLETDKIQPTDEDKAIETKPADEERQVEATQTEPTAQEKQKEEDKTESTDEKNVEANVETEKVDNSTEENNKVVEEVSKETIAENEDLEKSAVVVESNVVDVNTKELPESIEKSLLEEVSEEIITPTVAYLLGETSATVVESKTVESEVDMNIKEDSESFQENLLEEVSEEIITPSVAYLLGEEKTVETNDKEIQDNSENLPIKNNESATKQREKHLTDAILDEKKITTDDEEKVDTNDEEKVDTNDEEKPTKIVVIVEKQNVQQVDEISEVLPKVSDDKSAIKKTDVQELTTIDLQEKEHDKELGNEDVVKSISNEEISENIVQNETNNTFSVPEDKDHIENVTPVETEATNSIVAEKVIASNISEFDEEHSSETTKLVKKDTQQTEEQVVSKRNDEIASDQITDSLNDENDADKVVATKKENDIPVEKKLEPSKSLRKRKASKDQMDSVTPIKKLNETNSDVDSIATASGKQTKKTPRKPSTNITSIVEENTEKTVNDNELSKQKLKNLDASTESNVVELKPKRKRNASKDEQEHKDYVNKRTAVNRKGQSEDIEKSVKTTKEIGTSNEEETPKKDIISEENTQKKRTRKATAKDNESTIKTPTILEDVSTKKRHALRKFEEIHDEATGSAKQRDRIGRRRKISKHEPEVIIEVNEIIETTSTELPVVEKEKSKPEQEVEEHIPTTSVQSTKNTAKKSRKRIVSKDEENVIEKKENSELAVVVEVNVEKKKEVEKTEAITVTAQSTKIAARNGRKRKASKDEVHVETVMEAATVTLSQVVEELSKSEPQIEDSAAIVISPQPVKSINKVGRRRKVSKDEPQLERQKHEEVSPLKTTTRGGRKRKISKDENLTAEQSEPAHKQFYIVEEEILTIKSKVEEQVSSQNVKSTTRGGRKRMASKDDVLSKELNESTNIKLSKVEEEPSKSQHELAIGTPTPAKTTSRIVRTRKASKDDVLSLELSESTNIKVSIVEENTSKPKQEEATVSTKTASRVGRKRKVSKNEVTHSHETTESTETEVSTVEEEKSSTMNAPSVKTIIRSRKPKAAKVVETVAFENEILTDTVPIPEEEISTVSTPTVKTIGRAGKPRKATKNAIESEAATAEVPIVEETNSSVNTPVAKKTAGRGRKRKVEPEIVVEESSIDTQKIEEHIDIPHETTVDTKTTKSSGRGGYKRKVSKEEDIIVIDSKSNTLELSAIDDNIKKATEKLTTAKRQGRPKKTDVKTEETKDMSNNEHVERAVRVRHAKHADLSEESMEKQIKESEKVSEAKRRGVNDNSLTTTTKRRGRQPKQTPNTNEIIELTPVAQKNENIENIQHETRGRGRRKSIELTVVAASTPIISRRKPTTKAAATSVDIEEKPIRAGRTRKVRFEEVEVEVETKTSSSSSSSSSPPLPSPPKRAIRTRRK